MSILSFSKEKSELVLVLNIGTSFIGGALFWTQKSGIPKVIYSAREPIQIQDKLDIDRFLSLATQSLDAVINKIYNAKLGVPSKIFCILASPWHVSQTRIINLKKNAPFIFTEKLADSLIEKEIKFFEEEYLAKNTNVGKSIRTIELKNIKTLLNGYETSKPLNQKVKELEMVIFVSMSGDQILKKIEDTVAKYFHFDQIKFSSFAMASFTVIRDMNTEQENFLLVNIGGEITDISMTKKNILRESISFPLGRNFLIRGIASGLNCTLGEANSLISLYKDGHAEESAAQKVALIVNKLKAEWLKKFQESLANLSNDISIPATVYLVTERDLADFFSEIIKTEQFSQYTLTESKFEVIFLGQELLHGMAVFKEDVVRESSLVADSIYINRFLIRT